MCRGAEASDWKTPSAAPADGRTAGLAATTRSMRSACTCFLSCTHLFKQYDAKRNRFKRFQREQNSDESKRGLIALTSNLQERLRNRTSS